MSHKSFEVDYQPIAHDLAGPIQPRIHLVDQAGVDQGAFIGCVLEPLAARIQRGERGAARLTILDGPEPEDGFDKYEFVAYSGAQTILGRGLFSRSRHALVDSDVSSQWQSALALMQAIVSDLIGSDLQNSRLLLRLASSMDSLLFSVSRELELSRSETSALLSLWNDGSQSMAELASRVSLSRAAVTTLVDRMESAGFIQRVQDPVDHRRTLLEISEQLDQILIRAAVDSKNDREASSAGDRRL
ncbi:MAG: MarR family [Thermoleophilia bacterium]|nr:MarR family [Thermoleophilia bacterium]